MEQTDKATSMAFYLLQNAERLPLVRGAVWAVIGVIYGFVFVLIRAALPVGLFPGAEIVLPAVGTAAFGALLYGSMRLTVIAAIYAIVIVVVVFLFLGRPTHLPALLIAGLVSGAMVGMLFGWRVKNSLVYRADAKIIAGAAAGLLASLCALVPALFGMPLPLALEVLLLAPLSGLLYVGLAPHCVCRLSNLLPPVADGAVVGGGVGVLMAILFWMMSGTLEGYLPAMDQAFVDDLVAQWPLATLAASVGAFMAGSLRAILGVRWYDL
jgi:hypothetical protein